MTKVSRYWTQIRWIDPNGHGIISEYSFKAISKLAAEEKATKSFKEMYGDFWRDAEIRKIDTVLLTNGLQNQRKWNNPK